MLASSFCSVLGPGRSDGAACTSTGCATVAELLLLLSGLQNLETAHEGVVDGHHGTGIIEFTAVVGGREEGHQLTLGEELVAILNDLMSPADQVDVMLLGECRHDLLAKSEGNATVVLTPALDVLVGV